MVPDNRLAANTSDAGSDTDDDDFIPEPEPSAVSAPSTTHQKRAPGADDATDSDDEASDTEGAAGSSALASEKIDADELEALKRERAELVAAAGGEERLGKRRRLAQPTQAAEPIPNQSQALQAQALAEWEAIKDGDQAQSSSSISTDDMVSIPTTYKFAGELHTSMRSVPRSHPDAIKHLAAQSANANTGSAPIAEDSTSTPAQAPRRPPPGPRRKKGSSLAALSAAATAKPTKLNTLEKSKLDWDSYKGDTAKLSQQELDELEHQTKGGGKGLGDMKGYLERRDFLDRVKDRTGQP